MGWAVSSFLLLHDGLVEENSGSKIATFHTINSQSSEPILLDSLFVVVVVMVVLVAVALGVTVAAAFAWLPLALAVASKTTGPVDSTGKIVQCLTIKG